MAKNLINAERISQQYGEFPVFSDISLGVDVADRIGVVGRNGAGKSTLLRLLSGVETPLGGRVSLASGTRIGVLRQQDHFDAEATVRDVLLGDREVHMVLTGARPREVLNSLIGGHDDAVLTRRIGTLSGGERRRVDLARLLLEELDVLFLDEPTNHLDIEAVNWLADHLRQRASLAVVVVTHDRWFLDEVCNQMWEVVQGGVESYDGGYSAFILAKAERQRQQATELHKRKNLIRKELAWLRRGAPARTSKPKFRIDAANDLIAGEPPPRDTAGLLAFANSRLGKTVIEAKDVQIRAGGDGPILFDHLTWNIGPGDRIAILGRNGAGKTTLVNALLGITSVSAGSITTGVTVKAAYLSQHLDDLDPNLRVLEAVEQIATHVSLGSGHELSASQLCERIGFTADAQWTVVGELSGGERRRLQLTRLLMGAPNVLVLDEPTNDFDTETLASLEDLLDGFAGTLLVISHDRYFLERVCDEFRAVRGDGTIRDLPRGVDQYLAEGPSKDVRPAQEVPEKPRNAAVDRQRSKELARIERQLARAQQERTSILQALDEYATEHTKVLALSEDLREVDARVSDLEEAWFLANE